MKNVVSFHECALVGADDGTQDKLESTADELGDAFVHDIAARNGTVIPWTLRTLSFGDQGDSCDVPSLRKNSCVEEILDCFNHISAYYWPGCFIEATIEAIWTKSFIFKDAPYCLFNFILRIVGPP